MQACNTQQVDQIITAASTRALLCLFAFVFLLMATLQYSHADSGLINRSAYTIKKEKPKSGLDRLADSLGDIVKSIDQIVAEPDAGITSEKLIISEPVETRMAPNTAATNPTPLADKPTKNKTPSKLVPVSPAKPKPDLSKATTMATAKIPGSEIIKEVETPITNALTDQEDLSKPAFQKLNIVGKVLTDDAAQWACVEDTRNGLIWEVKESNGGLRDKKNSYSWFDPSHNELSGIADGGRCKGGIKCDTNAYVQALNSQNFCGHSDWRLPTREEIQQLVNLENDKAEATINQKLFPDTVPSWYWTSSTNKNNPGYAWYVLFRNGIPLNDLKQRPKHIRLVRTNKKA